MRTLNRNRILTGGKGLPGKWLGCLRILVLAGALSFLAFPASSQYMLLNLEVPAKTGMSVQSPMNFTLSPEPVTGLQSFMGTAVLSLSANENLFVQVEVLAEEPLVSDRNQPLPLHVTLSYLNDGSSLLDHAVAAAGLRAAFPLNASGRLVENMKKHPEYLSAFVIIEAQADTPPDAGETYRGSIKIRVEFN